MHFIVQILRVFLVVSISGCVMLSDASSFTQFRSQDTCAKKQKEGILGCVAQCLDLNGSSSRGDCKYQTDCTGCMALNMSSPLAIKASGLHCRFRAPNKRLCGKLFNFGSPIPVITTNFGVFARFRYISNPQFPHEYVQYACGFVDTTLKTWNPKDADDIKCVIGDLPLEWRKLGKLGLHAFKSKCLNKFKICETKYPRILDSSFLPIKENKSIPLGIHNGTCAMITYKSQGKNISDLALQEISCEESITPYMCEVR